MSFGGSRRLSLVEQKKLQWAKEREEMVGLCGLWGPVMSTSKTSDHIGVGLYGSKADNDSRFGLPTQYRTDLGKQEVDYGCPAQHFEGNKRSSSLPPIGSRSWSKQTEDESVEQDDSVATSGYNSDSAGTSEPGNGCRAEGADGGNREWPPEQEVDIEDGSAGSASRRHTHRLSRHAGWKQKEGSRWESEENIEAYEASLTNAEAMESASRARWGDHGVGVGHLWEPASVNVSAPRLPPVAGRAETPAWLSRGLDRLDRLQLGDRSGPDILVLPSRDMSTPSISEPSVNDSLPESFGRSFLRGQNLPLEADILAERQKRRERAINHQNAIRQQVEERDRKRREERELKMKMDLVEEERMKQEQEKMRLQEQLERQRIAERQEIEAKRLAAMAEALHIAREHAKDENSRLRRRHLQQDSSEESKPAQTPDIARNESVPRVARTPPLEDNRKKDNEDSVVCTSKKEKTVERTLEENREVVPGANNLLEGTCNSSTPQGRVPQGAVPNDVVSQGAVSHGAVSQRTASHGAVSHGTVSHGVVPHEAVPNGAVSHEVVSHGAISNEAVSHGAVSQGTVSQGAVSKGTVSQGTVSQGAASHEAVSQGAVSRGAVSYGTVSQGTDSQGAVSQGADPQGGVFQGAATQENETKAQSWVPVVEMFSPDGLACRSLSTGHSTVLLPPGLAHQTVSPLCLMNPDGSYASLSSAFPLQLPLPFIPMTQSGLPLALVFPTVHENTHSVRKREVGTQTSAGRRRSGWDGGGSGGSSISKHKCDRSTLTERPQWGVNRSGAKYIKQSDKDLSFRQRCHRSQRRRLVAPIIANGNNACARNRWWSTVQLSEDELSKTYLISSNPISSGSSSSGSGTAKIRNDDAADGEDERDPGDEYECIDENETAPCNEATSNAMPLELFSHKSALKIVR